MEICQCCADGVRHAGVRGARGHLKKAVHKQVRYVVRGCHHVHPSVRIPSLWGRKFQSALPQNQGKCVFVVAFVLLLILFTSLIRSRDPMPTRSSDRSRNTFFVVATYLPSHLLPCVCKE